MKKLLAAILILAYFTVNTGFIVSVHYCMNRYASSEIGGDVHGKCTSCGMEKKDGCCHDDVKVIKVSTDQLVAKVLSQDYSPALPVSDVPAFLIQQDAVDQPTTALSTHPPPLSGRSLLIDISVFRI